MILLLSPVPVHAFLSCHPFLYHLHTPYLILCHHTDDGNCMVTKTLFLVIKVWLVYKNSMLLSPSHIGLFAFYIEILTLGQCRTSSKGRTAALGSIPCYATHTLLLSYSIFVCILLPSYSISFATRCCRGMTGCTCVMTQ